jgi:drug/metabolite transporter (DMT)-like permease
MKHFRGQVVSTMNLSQAAFAGVLAFFFLDELPTYVFYPACLLMALGAWLSLRSDSAASLDEPPGDGLQAP